MSGPRKVRIFRDLKKSPNWYVEWRDAAGRRHCESCGPQREDADARAGQVKEELRRQREEAKRVEQDAVRDGAAPASGCDESTFQLQGLLRCDQVEVPITIRLEVPPALLMAIRQVIAEAGRR